MGPVGETWVMVTATIGPFEVVSIARIYHSSIKSEHRLIMLDSTEKDLENGINQWIHRSRKS